MHINNLSNAIRRKLEKAEKPDLSLKDWRHVLDYINTLEKVIKIINQEEYPEYVDMLIRELLKEKEMFDI